MKILADFRYSSKLCRHRFLLTCAIGAIVMFFPLLLVISAPQKAGPFVWFTLGTACGFELILWGTYQLHLSDPSSRWGKLLKEKTDSWYPLFLFTSRKLLILIFFVLLWFTLQDMGFPSSPLINILFITLLAIIPAKGYLLEYHHTSKTHTAELLHDTARYLIIIVSTIFTATVLTSLGPKQNTTASEINMLLILVWIASILVVITCLLLFLSRLPRHQPNPAAPKKDTKKQPGKKQVPVEY